MHHSLLPEKNSAAIHHEYRIRMLTVFLTALTISIFIGVAIYTPTFIGAYVVEGVNSNRSVTLKKAHDPELLRMKNEITQTSKLIDSSLSMVDKDSFSDIIEMISSQRGKVILNSFVFNRQATTTILLIKGISPTREELINFKDRLNQEPRFSANLPVSDLTKSTNINFSMAINIKRDEK